VTSFFVKPRASNSRTRGDGERVVDQRPETAPAQIAAVEIAVRPTEAAAPVVSDGRPLVMLYHAAEALRPNSALCGPRTNSDLVDIISSTLESWR